MIGTGAAILGAGLLGAGSSLLSSRNSAKAATSAANVQAQSARDAQALQMQMYQQSRSDLAPYMNFGAGAIPKLESIYGLNGRPADPTNFNLSPDYQFTFNEGERALNRSLAAKGELVSGNALKAATRFGQGAASQQFGNYFDRMSRIAGMGQSAAAGAGAGALQTGQTVGNSIMGAGQATASGIVGAANATSGGIQAIGSAPQSMLQNYMLMNYLNRGGNTGSSYGGGIGVGISGGAGL